MIMEKVYLGLGTNLGDRELNLRKAINNVNELIGSVVLVSSIYETEPVGFRSEEKFLNMVAEVDTMLKPSGVMDMILKAEALLGRVRKGNKYTSRIIDLDILLFGNRIIENDSLSVPHPMMHERRFVLIPLCEIAPDLVHPILEKSIKTLLSECQDKSSVIKYFE
jgi:2-amino-4-hydroxy-6-hydroxymethyldihydropteridine diphosphokinase